MENPTFDDYSNPQQGTITSLQKMQDNHQSPRKPFKVPPTRRDNRKIFVGGLPSNVTEEEFHEFFSQFGTVVDSIVMFDRETRRSRGFGFVTFEDPNVVQLLLEMRVDGTEGQGRVQMRGKVCEIKAAEPKEASNYNGRGRRGSNGNKGYRPSYPQQQGYPSNGGEAYQQYPAVNAGPTAVNRDVPSTLPPVHPMYPPYGMPAYYPSGAMPAAAAYPPYVGYPPDGAVQAHLYYDQQGNMVAEQPAYGAAMPSAMTATAPGPHAQQNEAGAYAAAAYGNGFVPVEDNQVSRQADESPNETPSGEEGKQP